MNYLRRLYRSIKISFSISLQTQLQYRSARFLWIVVSLLQTAVYICVWVAVAKAKGGSVEGYSQQEFAGYFLISLLLVELCYSGATWHFAHHVRQGSLSSKLLRPLHPLVEVYGRELGTQFLNTILVIPTIIVLWFVFDAQISTNIGAIASMIVVVPLAAYVRFCTDIIIGMTSMWLTSIEGVRGLYMFMALILGGRFAPLAVLPDWLQTLSLVLPFWWTNGFPTEVILARNAGSGIVVGVAVLIGWSMFLTLLVRVIWARGVRAYEAVGS